MNPIWILVATFALVLGFGALFCVRAFRFEKLAFRCRRCGHGFRRKAHARYPATCPSCGADDWSHGNSS